MAKIAPRSGSLAIVVRSYKAAVTRWCRDNGYGNFEWQSRYYDRVIRDQRTLDDIRLYVQNNPAKWATDPEHAVG